MRTAWFWLCRLIVGAGLAVAGSAAAQTVAPSDRPGLGTTGGSSTPGGGTPAVGVAGAPSPIAMAHYEEGRRLLGRGEHARAAIAFTLAISTAPGFALAYSGRGFAHLKTGAYETAVDDLSRALNTGGTLSAETRALIYANRGVAKSNIGKLEQAIGDLTRSIELSPGLAFAYSSRGFAHYQAKNHDAAIADATKAIEREPKSAFANLVRGLAHLGRRSYTEAAADFRTVLGLSPDNRSAILGLHVANLSGRDDEGPTKVRLIRDAEPECEPDCAEWISIQGRIDAGSAALLKPVLKLIGSRKVPVFVDSGGGSVNDAMEMGRAIRAAGLDVVVTRTELAACAKADKACTARTTGGRTLGAARSAGSICASSCGFLLASGARRYVGAATLVGVHQISSFTTYQEVWRRYRDQPELRDGKVVMRREVLSEKRGDVKKVQTRTGDATYVKVRRYFTEMGIDDGIMSLLISAPPKSMTWLSAAQLKATGIGTELAHGEQLLSRGGVPRFSHAAPAAGDSEAAVEAAAAPAVAAPIVPRARTVQPAAPLPTDPAELAQAIKTELTRLGCSPGRIDGKWDAGAKRAIERYNTLTGKPVPAQAAEPETLSALKARRGPVCPPGCPPGLVEAKGACIEKGAPVVVLAAPEAATPPAKRDGRTSTPPVSRGACTNFETSCAAAFSYCLRDCRERAAGDSCRAECRQAVAGCRESGTWKTAACRRSNLAR